MDWIIYLVTHITWQDVWIAFLTGFDVLSGAVLALALGYKLLPSALGLLIGGIGMITTGVFTPVYFQQESMVQAKRLAEEIRPRMTMILGAAVVTLILGLSGLPQIIVDWLGPEIFVAMLAGVGLMLTKVAIWDLAWKMNRLIGFLTIAVAMVVQYFTNNLILAISVSVPLGVFIMWLLVKTGRANYGDNNIPRYQSWREMMVKEFQIIRPVFNWKVVVGVLSLATLTLGANIAYPAVNASMTQGLEPGYNRVTIISSLADFGSSFFGGPSMEVVVSGTAAAPNPVVSGVILMFGAAIIILSGLATKMARFVPASAMAGYLAAIGLLLVAIPSGQEAFAIGNPIVVLVTGGVTLVTNPFWGLVAGVTTKFLLGLVGVL